MHRQCASSSDATPQAAAMETQMHVPRRRPAGKQRLQFPPQSVEQRGHGPGPLLGGEAPGVVEKLGRNALGDDAHDALHLAPAAFIAWRIDGINTVSPLI